MQLSNTVGFLDLKNAICPLSTAYSGNRAKLKIISLLTGLVLMVLLLVAPNAFAANHYVRQGASGSGNGTDWTNAFTSLPGTLIRGDTYYIAAGSYPAYTFDDAESSSLVTTIKKATTIEHGTETGWSSGYGSSQAVFNSTMRFNTGYYLFDGLYRNENDWFAGDAYGFRISHNNQNQNIVINASNITIKYVYIKAIYQNLPNTTIRRYAIDTDSYGGPIRTGLLFQRMYIYGSNQHWFLRTTNGAIVEYSASKGIASNAANHGNLINLYFSGNNAIIRYNKIRDAFVGNGGTSIVSISDAHGVEFYGNLVSNFETGDAAIGYGNTGNNSSNNNKVYNNTFIDGVGWNSGVSFATSTGNYAYNNLFINCTKVYFANVAHNYNGFSNSDARGESKAQTNIPISIFNNYDGKDFTLAYATINGYALSSPYDKDLLGNIRGAEGVFGRGAYEYKRNNSGIKIQNAPGIIKIQ